MNCSLAGLHGAVHFPAPEFVEGVRIIEAVKTLVTTQVMFFTRVKLAVNTITMTAEVAALFCGPPASEISGSIGVNNQT